MKNAFEYEAELTALREELLRLEEEYDTLEHANITLKLSLADAERRNAKLVELLRHVFYSVGYWNSDTCDQVEAAIKPTESGARE